MVTPSLTQPGTGVLASVSDPQSLARRPTDHGPGIRPVDNVGLIRDGFGVGHFGPFLSKGYVPGGTDFSDPAISPLMSRAAAKHTTVAERKCTTEIMADDSDFGVGVATGTVAGAEDAVASCRLPLMRWRPAGCP